jgi:pantetheine-phosphate adenylyltransferase
MAGLWPAICFVHRGCFATSFVPLYYNQFAVHTIKAIYPGSFDPVTNGHLDLIARGSKLFDHLVVAILQNASKSPLFSEAERVEMLTEGVRQFGNVSVATFKGLLVDFAREQHAEAVIRGVRAISDYEYELQMALMNRRLAPELETIFLMSDAKYSFVSSRLVKQVFELGGSVEGLVPPFVIERMKARRSS